jgi:MoaA/NifB/PqqE/SkfB family radical SAM enzyme
MELEPLFACNLKCEGCGKIQHPASLLKQRMPVEQALAAVEECGAPMVAISGGEPLMHPQIDVLTAELLKRKKLVVLCTNALLMAKHLHKFKPNRNFAWMVHIDGLGDRHDEAVARSGVFDQGKREFACTPWGIPSYSLRGWQRPCYLLADGHASSWRELLDTTDWQAFGRGRDPRCDNCMAHCGYEPTAVLATTQYLRESLRALARAR